MSAKKSRKRRRWLHVLTALIAAGILFEGVMLYLVVRAEKVERPLQKADAIIVLGARVQPTGALSTQLKYRTLKALELYERGLADWLIPCGAQGADEPKAEADAMADYFIARGVPESAIVREDQSFDTAQNILNARKIMETRGLETAIIVTSDYHVQRALWIAGELGVSAQGAGAQASDYPALLWKSRLRETFGWTKYHLIDRWMIVK